MFSLLSNKRHRFPSNFWKNRCMLNKLSHLKVTFMMFKWYKLLHYKEISAIYWITLLSNYLSIHLFNPKHNKQRNYLPTYLGRSKCNVKAVITPSINALRFFYYMRNKRSKLDLSNDAQNFTLSFLVIKQHTYKNHTYKH